MTKEQFEQQQSSIFRGTFVKYDPPAFDCPECGGGMCKDNTLILPSWPPQYQYVCNKCGHIEYSRF